MPLIPLNSFAEISKNRLLGSKLDSMSTPTYIYVSEKNNMYATEEYHKKNDRNSNFYKKFGELYDGNT
jgi:hypothetical protein